MCKTTEPRTSSLRRGLVMKAGTLTPPSSKDPRTPENGKLPSGRYDPLSDKKMIIVLFHCSVLLSNLTISPTASSTDATIPFLKTSSSDVIFFFLIPLMYFSGSSNGGVGGKGPVKDTCRNHGVVLLLVKSDSKLVAS